jgi:hypothetical protein
LPPGCHLFSLCVLYPTLSTSSPLEKYQGHYSDDPNVPLAARLANPHGLAAHAGAGIGAGFGGLVGVHRGLNQPIGKFLRRTLKGGAIGGALGYGLGMLGQQELNQSLINKLRELPEGQLTVGDLQHDPGYQHAKLKQYI